MTDLLDTGDGIGPVCEDCMRHCPRPPHHAACDVDGCNCPHCYARMAVLEAMADDADQDAPSAPVAAVAEGLTLTPQQREAADKVATWYAHYQSDQGLYGSQVFRLFGYAGTGKTSLARHLVDELGVTNVIYSAFTGKAAYVLRRKDCADAQTIHSLIYLPAEKARKKLKELTDQLDRETNPTEREILQKLIRLEKERLETPSWILRSPQETALTTASLLVVDEVSMVGEQMAADLLSFGVPILVLGDPAQLPPVEGGGYFINAEPDHLLTEVHRFALDSPVMRLATTVRGATVGQPGYGIVGADGDSGRVERMSVADLLSFDQVLVGTNATRWQAIHLLRALRGQVGDEPVPGDRLIVLANNPDMAMFNGQQLTAREIAADPKREDRLRITAQDDEGELRTFATWRCGFAGLEGEKDAKREGRGGVVAATFGHAITVHKAQGSQWSRVLVVDESGVFARIASKEKDRARRGAGLADRQRAAQAGHLAGQRWLYTAITRAEHQVTLVPRIRGLLV